MSAVIQGRISADIFSLRGNPVANERIGLQNVIYGRTAGLLYLVFVRAWPKDLPRLDISPHVAANPLYNDPIEFGMRCAGYLASVPSLVADADVAVIRGDAYGVASDLAEYRMIANCLGSFTNPDETVSVRSQGWNSVANRFATRLAQLEVLYKHLLKASIPIVTDTIYRLPIADGCRSEWDGGGCCR